MILVDTSAWFALLSERDLHHAEARSFFREIALGQWGAPVTTDYILDETYTLLRLKDDMASVRHLADLLARSPTIRRVRVSENLFDSSLQLLLGHADKRWSFTDCTSFEVMREAGIRRAFTLDHNFAEAGFEILPAIWSRSD